MYCNVPINKDSLWCKHQDFKLETDEQQKIETQTPAKLGYYIYSVGEVK